MNNQEAIEIIKVAKAEVEWDYPMDYQIAFDKAIEALEKQIVIDKSIPSLRQCVEDSYYDAYRKDRPFWLESINYMRTRAWALYDVAIDREKHIEDMCMLDSIWEMAKEQKNDININN